MTLAGLCAVGFGVSMGGLDVTVAEALKKSGLVGAVSTLMKTFGLQSTFRSLHLFFLSWSSW